MMARRVYDREELLRSDEFTRPHVENGQLLHGGFDTNGRYRSPRLRYREEAVANWTQALRDRGGDLLPADSSLLSGIRYPNAAQHKLLIQEGLGQTFWNTLTITGRIEARGRLLTDITFPEIGDAVVEDVSEMAVGHLNRGLLEAHGLDEGGEPERGIGGHDVMWFTLRDLAFGDTGFSEPAIPEIARPVSKASPFPNLPESIQRTLDFLANLLMIEFRAERGFALTETLLRDPEIFGERRSEAELAADIVDRIRTDEEIHVSSLRLYLGEISSLTFRKTDGGRLDGREVVDEIWSGIVRWATVEQPPLVADQQRRILAERILAHPDGERVRREFDALEENG